MDRGAGAIQAKLSHALSKKRSRTRRLPQSIRIGRSLFGFDGLDFRGRRFVSRLGGHANRLAFLQIADLGFLAVQADDLGIVFVPIEFDSRGLLAKERRTARGTNAAGRSRSFVGT